MATPIDRLLFVMLLPSFLAFPNVSLRRIMLHDAPSDQRSFEVTGHQATEKIPAIQFDAETKTPSGPYKAQKGV